MRLILPICLTLAAVAAEGDVRFVTPSEGAQVFGPTRVEIETNAQKIDRVEFLVDGRLAAVARTAPYRATIDFGESTVSRRVAAHVFSNGFATRESAEIITGALTAGENFSVDLVEVPLRIRSTRRLATNDLTLIENGVEQRLIELRAQRAPAHFAFIVDRSLSMDDGKLEAALDAVERSLGQLRADDEASIILFNHRVDRARKVEKGLVGELQRSVRPSGGTALRDAIVSTAANRGTIAIVISDGSDRNSFLSEADALKRVSNAHFSLFALTFDDRPTPFVRQAAERSGGSYRRTSAATVAGDLAEVLADINSRHIAVYQSSLHDRGWREIAVRTKRRGLEVAGAKRGYFAE